jgi:hypothetical protein
MADEKADGEVSLEDLEKAKQALLKRTIKEIHSLKASERLKILEFIDEELVSRRVKNTAAGVISGGTTYTRASAIALLSGRGKGLLETEK